MGRHGAGRIRRSAKQWVEIVRRFEASGLGAGAFCRREHVPASSFHRWRRRVGLAKPTGFVELVPGPSPAAAPSSAEPPNWSVELRLPNGLSIQVRG